MPENDRADVLRRAVEACIQGDVGPLPELFSKDVSGWSPNMLVTLTRRADRNCRRP